MNRTTRTTPARKPVPALAIVGYIFAGGCAICTSCHAQHTATTDPLHATNYPRLSYLRGGMTTLWNDQGPFDRYCDECGEKLEPKT